MVPARKELGREGARLGAGNKIGNAEVVRGLHRRAVVLITQPGVDEQTRDDVNIVLDVGADAMAPEVVEAAAADGDCVIGNAHEQLGKDARSGIVGRSSHTRGGIAESAKDAGHGLTLEEPVPAG